MLPVDPAHTVPAVVIVAPGSAVIDTALLPEEVLHPLLLVTVTLSVTDPELLAV